MKKRKSIELDMCCNKPSKMFKKFQPKIVVNSVGGHRRPPHLYHPFIVALKSCVKAEAVSKEVFVRSINSSFQTYKPESKQNDETTRRAAKKMFKITLVDPPAKPDAMPLKDTQFFEATFFSRLKKMLDDSNVHGTCQWYGTGFRIIDHSRLEEALKSYVGLSSSKFNERLKLHGFEKVLMGGKIGYTKKGVTSAGFSRLLRRHFIPAKAPRPLGITGVIRSIKATLDSVAAGIEKLNEDLENAEKLNERNRQCCCSSNKQGKHTSGCLASEIKDLQSEIFSHFTGNLHTGGAGP